MKDILFQNCFTRFWILLSVEKDRNRKTDPTTLNPVGLELDLILERRGCESSVNRIALCQSTYLWLLVKFDFVSVLQRVSTKTTSLSFLTYKLEKFKPLWVLHKIANAGRWAVIFKFGTSQFRGEGKATKQGTVRPLLIFLIKPLLLLPAHSSFLSDWHFSDEDLSFDLEQKFRWSSDHLRRTNKIRSHINWCIFVPIALMDGAVRTLTKAMQPNQSIH